MSNLSDERVLRAAGWCVLQNQIRRKMSSTVTENDLGSFAAMLATIQPKTDAKLAENIAKLIEGVRSTGKKALAR
ncbi:MAG: hypothetical protein B5766_08285 [Candidatus Lumbricidophila eiseniae]|uniref:Uncharacterized protein n=1 Tax=Candidatus Lumbricidiphila eiseniae TaxID=1969409 RepID=A0A2A6FQN1_9MICO|nr:MAG: hypothetical protein B5766_08285 [Candidatus Lumbricidophila eiseniae]